MERHEGYSGAHGHAGGQRDESTGYPSESRLWSFLSVGSSAGMGSYTASREEALLQSNGLPRDLPRSWRRRGIREYLQVSSTGGMSSLAQNRDMAIHGRNRRRVPAFRLGAHMSTGKAGEIQRFQSAGLPGAIKRFLRRPLKNPRG